MVKSRESSVRERDRFWLLPLCPDLPRILRSIIIDIPINCWYSTNGFGNNDRMSKQRGRNWHSSILLKANLQKLIPSFLSLQVFWNFCCCSYSFKWLLQMTLIFPESERLLCGRKVLDEMEKGLKVYEMWLASTFNAMRPAMPHCVRDIGRFTALPLSTPRWHTEVRIAQGHGLHQT
jgi:hypothetical protein